MPFIVLEYQLVFRSTGRCILPKDQFGAVMDGDIFHAYLPSELDVETCCDVARFSNIGGVWIENMEAYCIDYPDTIDNWENESPMVGLGNFFV